MPNNVLFRVEILTGLLVGLFTLSCAAQTEIPLYTKGSVSKGQPSITVFLPAGNSNGKAVLICPGGGYHTLVSKREGTDVALAFNKAGVTAFVLKYRLPQVSRNPDKRFEPIQDAQTALKIIRERANEWHVSKVGVMGFSAGGHLAATAGTHFDQAYISNPNGTNLRPDFMALIYPVISFKDEITHSGSRTNLIGPIDSPDFRSRIDHFSNENHVSAMTPPTFLTHAADDSIVPLSNTMVFFDALSKFKVPTELHVYPKGGHGYLEYPAFDDWFGNCLKWVLSLN